MSGKGKGCCGCLSSLFVFIGIIILIMVFTNPKQEELVQELKNREGAISVINIEKRDNFVVMSFYKVQVSSINQGFMTQKRYIGVLGQIVEVK